MACDVDIRASLLQNIVVVGNTSLTRGLTERLDVELALLMPSQKIKIHSPTIPFEKKYAPWLGGSVLASLGTFHQLWVTKDEYEEHGMSIVHQREWSGAIGGAIRRRSRAACVVIPGKCGLMLTIHRLQVDRSMRHALFCHVDVTPAIEQPLSASTPASPRHQQTKIPVGLSWPLLPKLFLPDL
jgi:hypothetical protein